MARLPLFLRRRPPPEAIAWVERALGHGARVTSVERLRAGSSAAVHLLRVRDDRGPRPAVVLKRFVRADWVAREPDLAEREARVLQALEGIEIAGPRLIAVDPHGQECDAPAVLMTRLTGRLDLAPADLGEYLRAIVEPLPALHAVGLLEGLPSYYPYPLEHGLPLPVPKWSRRPDVWSKALDLMLEPWPQTERTFIHRDYHPGNLLWSRGRLSGVTDWVNASIGPPAMDAAHCRVNVAGLFGVEAAAEFRRAYEAAAGVEQHPFWDLLDAIDTMGHPSATQWHDAGRHDLTDAEVQRRDDEYVASLVRELC